MGAPERCYASVVTRGCSGDARALHSRRAPVDGHCSGRFCVALIDAIILCDRGRLFNPFHNYQLGTRVVDAVTGALSTSTYQRLFADTSNAMLWAGLNGVLMASSGPASDGCTLSGVEGITICCFRFGAAVGVKDCQLHVLRLDGDPAAPAVEPNHKASALVRVAMWLTWGCRRTSDQPIHARRLVR